MHDKIRVKIIFLLIHTLEIWNEEISFFVVENVKYLFMTLAVGASTITTNIRLEIVNFLINSE